MFIDTHCHLSRKYYDDIDKVISENQENGVKKLIISACEYDDFKESLDLVSKYERIYLTIGFHPSEVNNVDNDKFEELVNILKTNSKVVGVGEIGLDYHYGKEDAKEQVELFERQLALAEELDLPVVIHTRDATEQTIDILKKHNNRGVIHCFSGSLEVAKIYLNLGYKLGIGGVVTFENSRLSDVLKHLSLSDLVLETDSPYLTPTPYRGKQNSSKYVPFIAEKVAQIYGVSVSEVEKITTATATHVFDL